MNELMIFNNPEFGEVRTISEDGKVLFCGADVTAALGYKNARKALADHCKGVTKRYAPTPGGQQEMNFISEGDVFRLIVKSELPEAEKVESWIFDEVLPSIRRKGYYSAIPDEQLAKELVAGMSDEWKLDNVIIPALRQGDIDQSILVAKYMGLTADEYEKNPKLLRKSMENLSAKRKIGCWKGKVFARDDIPEKYRNMPITLLAIRKMKKRYSCEGWFAEFCGTLYFNWRGYESIINYLLSQRVVSSEEATEWKRDVRRENHAVMAVSAGMP